MNFIKGVSKLVNNSIELNTLKNQRDDLRKKLDHQNMLLNDYDNNIQLLHLIETNIQNNQLLMNGIEKQFINNNINLVFNETLEQFQSKNDNQLILSLYKTYILLLQINDDNNKTIAIIKPSISNNKPFYEKNITDLRNQIERINEKLKVVRGIK
jgi:hypothetical protein